MMLRNGGGKGVGQNVTIALIGCMREWDSEKGGPNVKNLRDVIYGWFLVGNSL